MSSRNNCEAPASPPGGELTARLLTELGYVLWIGDALKIRASEVRKQKTSFAMSSSFSSECCAGAFLLPGLPRWSSGICHCLLSTGHSPPCHNAVDLG